MNFLKLIIEASIVVQFVLLVLLFFSVFSWAIILFKRKSLKTADLQSKKFLDAFRRSRNLSDVTEAARKYKASPLASLFLAGFKELAHYTRGNPSHQLEPAHLERINRALIKASNEEVSRLEKMMNFLATTGSVTPFIGLFGTVVSILETFAKLNGSSTASLTVIAPAISEALVATAAGIFVAIPAYSAHVFLKRQAYELLSLLDREIDLLKLATSRRAKS